MTISSPEVNVCDDVAYCRFNIGSRDSTTLWISVPSKFGELVSDTCDAALVGLLIPAMEKGEDIVIDGPVSARLFHHASGLCQEILQRVMPWLQRVTIKADQICKEKKRGKGVATGFSCGVDSFSVLSDYYYSDVLESFKITHLFFNNTGSHGKGGERLFNQRYQLVKAAADKIGLPLIKVNSNLYEFYDEKHLYLQTHTLRNLCVPYLLQEGIGRFYYASSAGYDDVHLKQAGETSYCEPVLLPLFSTDWLDLMSVGAQYTRVEKTIQVAELPVSHHFLNVCTRSDKAENCSKCKKCMRTLLTLEMTGQIDKYAGVFDLDTYYRKKKTFMEFVLKGDRVSSREIIDYAKEAGYRFPISTRINAKLKRLLGK